MALLMLPFAPLASVIVPNSEVSNVEARDSEAWYGDEFWGQFRHNPTRNSSMPAHSSDGGPKDGAVDNVTSLMTIDDPVVNWHHLTDSHYGADGYGTVIGDFSSSITAPPAAAERCGQGISFAVMVHSQDVGGQIHSILSIIDGGSGKTAWKVDLGATEPVKAAPAVVDIDDDGLLEIMVAYDSDAAANLEVYSPRLSCSESGWDSSGHTSELLWTWSDSEMRLGTDSPHFAVQQSDHLVSTQLLIADLQMDGGADAVLALIDQNTGNPTIKAIQLSTTGPPEPTWSVTLDRGTHVSDPTWVAMDDLNSAILLTTIDGSNGNMWVWRIDGASGSLDWERVTLSGTQTDADPVHLRVPGPIVAQLDNDNAPEVIFTIPSDQNGRSSGNGATYVAWDLTSTDELWRFRAYNGYADAAPIAIDDDGDGIDEKVCWVTWYSTSSITFERQGLAGCHDVSGEPSELFRHTMDSSSGNDNDEIAASAPLSIDIDGEGDNELVVAFGRRLFAFDVGTGTSAGVNSDWANALALPHRTWSSPAAGDLDGDGALDLLIGDTLVSRTEADAAPTSDSRGITFNPEQPDPGKTVTISAQFSNIGTTAFEGGLDAVLYLGGEEIGRHRSTDLEPVAPTGDGGPVSFSVDIVATRGVHEVKLVLDPLGNHSQAREDNDAATAFLEVLDPYVVDISPPLSLTRILPGQSENLLPTITATGRKAATWSMSIEEHLPEGWTVVDATSGGSQMVELVPGIAWNPTLRISIPDDAEGSESGHLVLIMTLDDDSNISFNSTIPVEVLRTQGLSIQGPDGLPISHGSGRIGHDASAWFLIENLGNAYETSSSITWDLNGWQKQPRIVDSNGAEVNLIELQPGETREFVAMVEVPTDSVSLGEWVTNNLEICIGSSEQTLCRDIDFRFTANGVSLSPPHIRQEPQLDKTWEIQVSKPGGIDLSWDLGAAGLLKEGWVWSAEGDLQISAGILSTIAGPSPASGWLNLSIPGTTPPDIHVANISSAERENHDLNLSLHVLQVHRSDISLSQSLPEPWMVNVSSNENDEGDRLILRLENPGNGLDSFLLAGEVVLDENHTSDPGVTFLISNPVRNLSAGAVVHVPVNVSLPPEIPARTPLQLRFTLTSLMLPSVSDSVDVTIQARPDHRWQLQLSGDEQRLAAPDESVSFQFNASNVGNSLDHLEMQPQLELQKAGEDSSQWQFSGSSLSDIQTGDSGDVWVNCTVPSNAWNGTVAIVNISVVAEDVIVSTIEVRIEVSHKAGWGFNLSNTTLEVSPEGGTVSIVVEQRGNLPTSPWFSLVMPEWNLSYPSNAQIISPGNQTTLDIEVTPPEDGLAGQVSLLVIRARESDGEGLGQVTIPLRIGAVHELELHAEDAWKVTREGGIPLVWFENTGNALSNIEIELEGVPDGWMVNGPSNLVVAAGQKSGLELDLDPADDWDGTNVLITINITADGGIQIEHDISVQLSNSSWKNSPLLTGLSGDEIGIRLYGEVTSIKLTGASMPLQAEGELWWFTLPENAADVQVEVTTSQGEEDLQLRVEPIPKTSRGVSCNINNGVAGTLGATNHNSSATLAACTITNGSTALKATLILLTNEGDIVQSQIINAPANTVATFNLSSQGWQGEPGNLILEVRAIDSHGRLLSSDTLPITIRMSGWNIGIAYLEERSNGDIRVGVLRTDEVENVLEGVDCRLEMSSNEWSATWTLDVVSSDFAPIIDLPRPAVADGERVDVQVYCETPFDIDDNASDNSDSIVLSTQEIAEEMEAGIIWGSGVAILTLFALWWGGLLIPKAQDTTIGPERKKKTATTSPRKESVKQEVSDESLHLEGSDGEAERISLIEIENATNGEEIPAETTDSGPGVDIRQRIKELRASAREQVEVADDADDLDRRIDELFSRRSKDS